MSLYPLCPFYEKLNKDSLLCECKEIEFPSIKDRDMWLSMHCNTWKFKICVFYRKLMAKYDAIDT